jgi:LCP family protein required for cell wall assembly
VDTLPGLIGQPSVQAPDTSAGYPRATQRGLSLRRPKPAPLYRRPGFYLPLALVLSFLVTVGACWWAIPVRNALTGEQENRGSQVVRGMQNLFNPQKSLQQSFMGHSSATLLLIGLDHVPSRKKDPFPPRRADSILLANIGFETKQVRLLSIPRDGWVEQLRLNRSGELETAHDKIGHSFSYGMQEDSAAPYDAGRARTKATVEALTGQPIDFYVVIQFEGFVKLIDALGGLDVDVEKRMKYRDRAGGLYIDLQKGLQHLDGEQAVGYARFRHDAESDIGRMRRQQQIIKLVIDKLKQPEIAMKYQTLAQLMAESISTNLTLDQLYALAQHSKEFEPGGIQSQTLPSYYNNEPGHHIDLEGAYRGVSAQWINPDEVVTAMAWLNDLTPPPPPPPPLPEGEVEGSAEGAAAAEGAGG